MTPERDQLSKADHPPPYSLTIPVNIVEGTRVGRKRPGDMENGDMENEEPKCKRMCCEGPNREVSRSNQFWRSTDFWCACGGWILILAILITIMMYIVRGLYELKY